MNTLREISLDHTGVSDLSPLAGLARLRRLSLAGTALGPGSLSTLALLAERLSHLDLAGATGLSNEEAAGLRGSPSNLKLILPDGTTPP